MPVNQPPVILTIAGSDPSGGAGIQADMKTIHANEGYAVTVITAVTTQNTMGVQSVEVMPAAVVASQLRAVLTDIEPKAIKIGMLGNEEIIHTVAEILQQYGDIPVVLDPIIASTSGKILLSENAIKSIQNELFPISTLITPNIPEAELLLQQKIDSATMENAARNLSEKYHTSVLLKGGHLEGAQTLDLLYTQGDTYEYRSPKIESRNLHGTGCTLSSAIALFLAYGHPLYEAVDYAKNYIFKAILHGRTLHIGHGNGPLAHFF